MNPAKECETITGNLIVSTPMDAAVSIRHAISSQRLTSTIRSESISRKASSGMTMSLTFCLESYTRGRFSSSSRPYGSVAERSPSKRKVHSSILCGGITLFAASALALLVRALILSSASLLERGSSSKQQLSREMESYSRSRPAMRNQC